MQDLEITWNATFEACQVWDNKNVAIKLWGGQKRLVD